MGEVASLVNNIRMGEFDSVTVVNNNEGRRTVRIAGYASKPVVGLDKAIVEPGFFANSLQDFMNNPVMYWLHESTYPQGRWLRVEDRQDGLWVEGELYDLGGPEDEWHLNLVETGVVKSLSVGFQGYYTGEYGYEDENGIWHWAKNGRLLEISVVPVPACPGAEIEIAHARGYKLERRAKGMIERGVVPYQDLPPCSDPERSWSADEAISRVRKWAGGPDPDTIDWGKYRKAFLWYDSENPELFGSYKFPIADVEDGRLVVVYKACVAALVRLSVANIPDDDKAQIRNQLRKYYKKFDKPFPENQEQAHAVAEEIRTLDNIARLEDAAYSIANIVRHWQREGGAPSAEVVNAAVRPITVLTDIIRAGQGLPEDKRQELRNVVEALQEVVSEDNIVKLIL